MPNTALLLIILCKPRIVRELGKAVFEKVGN